MQITIDSNEPAPVLVACSNFLLFLAGKNESGNSDEASDGASTPSPAEITGTRKPRTRKTTETPAAQAATPAAAPAASSEQVVAAAPAESAVSGDATIETVRAKLTEVVDADGLGMAAAVAICNEAGSPSIKALPAEKYRFVIDACNAKLKAAAQPAAGVFA